MQCTVGAQTFSDSKKVSQSIFLTSNTGESSEQAVLEKIAELSKEAENPVLLLLGNLVSDKERKMDAAFMEADQLKYIEAFEGQVIAIPGENEWELGGLEPLEELEDYLQDKVGLEFWPNDGCPLEKEDLGENAVLVTVDSQWFLEDWDDHTEMNSGCDYDTREEFFMEFKDDLGDSQGKTVIVAIHHPVLSNPQPSPLKRLTGLSETSIFNPKYKALVDRLETLASLHDDVIFVSGNRQNLQLLNNGRNPQIISGASGSVKRLSEGKDSQFYTSEKGFAKLIIYEDGSSKVEFFDLKSTAEPIFAASFPRERPVLEDIDLPQYDGPSRVSASIYSSEETDKGGLYELLWGERYRSIYDDSITAPVLLIDSLPGNLRPISEGGGQQSRSLRLINDNKNEYTLRAMRKDPLQYVQADLVKNQYIDNFLDSTVVQRYISDYFTTAHPYAPFAVNELSDAASIYHANPEIYYVPKQKGLGIYNEEYGNALFMFEEHVGEENRKFETFGSPENILSTADLLLKLKETKKAYVDQESYIRARLFDMLIGDWDRHQDQWRWAQFSDGDKTKYRPIPRDRDHAFSKYDGPLLAMIKAAVPLLRKMQSYDENIDNVKWFNWSGYPLDQRFLTTADWEQWEEQVEFLQENLTDQQIEKAFKSLPEEIPDKGLSEIIEKFSGRRSNLMDIARRYYEYLQDFQVVTGTEEDETFTIERQENGITTIRIFQGDTLTFENVYNEELTEEIWLYGLDGEDTFQTSGKGDDLIEIKVLGGYEDDIYNFKNTSNIKVYDYKAEENKFLNKRINKRLLNSYSINKYQYLKRKYDVNKVLPLINFETDAGFTLGIKDVYTTYGLVNNPFESQYIIGANYYFDSSGYKVFGSAEFAHIFYDWNFGLSGFYSSPNYSLNFFGFGSNSPYDSENVEKDYHKVMVKEWKVSPSLIWRSPFESTSFSISPLIESHEVSFLEDTYLSDTYSKEAGIFDSQLYAGTELNFNYFNKNNSSYPSMGTEFSLISGYKTNIDEHENKFGYAETFLALDYPLVKGGFAVIATKIGGEAILGDHEFYHGATIGGNRSLRGYRNHRFNGDYSFYQSTDIRTALGILKTKFIPFIYGVTAGFDYGRVWLADGESANKWHTDYGGSVWLNGAYALTLNVGYYHGDDGNRISIMLNFKF